MMNNTDYEKVYEQLGIKTEPLPANYTPDEYGKMLMSLRDSYIILYSTSVSYELTYSSQTDTQQPPI